MTQHEAQAILQCEQHRLAALMQGDLPMVDALLAEDLTFVHSNGQFDSKSQFMEKLGTRYYQFASISADDVHVRVHGVVGTLTGTGQMRVQVQGRPASLRYRYTIVYRKAQDRWQIAALHHTRLPDS